MRVSGIERFKVVSDRPIRELSKGNRQEIGLVCGGVSAADFAVLILVGLCALFLANLAFQRADLDYMSAQGMASPFVSAAPCFQPGTG